MIFKSYPCDWCGSEQYTIVMESQDYLTDMPGCFRFVKCNQCGLLRQNPRLDWSDLLEYYPEGFPSHAPQITEIPSKVQRLNKRYGLWKRVRLVHNFKTSGNWLDVGCGTGRILQEAQTWHKWQLFGLEPIPHLAEYTQQKLNIPVQPLPLEKFNGTAKYFDIITMWDVLEHLPSPTEDIIKVSSLLKEGGIFIFTIPNLISLERKIFKNTWIGYELPRHLHLYPSDLVRKILDNSGLMILTTTCIAGSHGSLMLDLARWNKEIKSRLISKIVEKGEDYLPFRMITLIPLWILDKLKLGTNITYIAKKL